MPYLGPGVPHEAARAASLPPLEPQLVGGHAQHLVRLRVSVRVRARAGLES